MGKIKDLPLLERPREKAIRYGISSLSNPELIAILIGSGTKEKSALDIANELISKYNGINNLLRLDLSILMENKGISIATALRIATVLQLANVLEKFDNFTDVSLEKSYKIINEKYQRLLANECQEKVYLIGLNSKGFILFEKLMYIGTESTTTVSIKEIIKQALISKGKYLILIHNHPNGELMASDADLNFTYKLNMECKHFNMHLFDHIIVGNNKCVSLMNKNE